MNERKYGLFTAIAMITGIVIGSGIFFRSDNILAAVDGSIINGVIAFAIAAISIIFGSLTIAQLAARTDNPGGVITYAEEFCSKPIACSFGWFQSLLYLPSICSVISWVAGIYTCMLFGIEQTLLTQTLVGVGIFALLSLMNYISARLGGYFQNISMVVKLIPLICIAILGLIFGTDSPETVSTLTRDFGSVGFMAAIPAVIFSFDGWIVSTSICHEIKNSKKNLPLALVISPLIILVVYIFYFVGISLLVGPDKVIALSDAHVEEAFTKLFGAAAGKIPLVFVVVSILGVLNGLILGASRMPHSIAIRGMIPWHKALSKNKGNIGGVPFASAAFTFVLSAIWMVINFVTQKFELIPNSDVSEISVITNYASFIILYITVIRLAIKGEIKSKLFGFVIPVLAILGAFMIIYSGFSNPLFPVFILISIAVMVSAYIYGRVNIERINEKVATMSEN